MVVTTQTWKIGDCLELLKEIPDKSIDLILTDLPYELTSCTWDKTIPFEPLWSEYERIIKDNGVIILSSTQPFTTILINSNLKLFRYVWYWLKEKPTGFANCNRMPMKIVEEICVFYKQLPNYHPIKQPRRHKYMRTMRISSTQSETNRMTSTKLLGKHIIRTHITPINVLCYARESQNGNGFHPTQKPLELWEYLIQTYTNEGDTVHDSCLGSGTTLEACMNLNRNCIGFEIDPQWEPIYKKRLKLNNSKLHDYINQ